MMTRKTRKAKAAASDFVKRVLGKHEKSPAKKPPGPAAGSEKVGVTLCVYCQCIVLVVAFTLFCVKC